MRLLPCLTILALAVLWLAPADPAAAADFPKGTFTKKVEAGTWAVTFDGKDKFTATLDGQEGVVGKYKVTKDEIEFTDESGPYAGEGEEKVATYKWKLDGKKLSFTKVKDVSAGREAVVAGDPWLLKE